ncbi:hypothetical protein IGI04_030104 [Brassica rapa subsp. trilocularis]|uniref:Uncharacterized protein n=1 Tax=Brassica rapa subsp. trilocularis TaxID=1813537 RepID=A0ABQ7LPR1_BRACM|nr:hypothetical protein IGI04_030104 [Brassica rapa subsp. trilocularis]
MRCGHYNRYPNPTRSKRFGSGLGSDKYTIGYHLHQFRITEPDRNKDVKDTRKSLLVCLLRFVWVCLLEPGD